MFPETELPERKARLTPLSRAAETLSNICWVQYSSWPTEIQPFARRRPLASACVSRFEM